MIDKDVTYVKDLLPNHYSVIGKDKSINCKSNIGLRMNGSSDDDEHWSYIFLAIKQHFGKRFTEVYHHTNAYHQNFTIYLK